MLGHVCLNHRHESRLAMLEVQDCMSHVQVMELGT